MAEKKEKQYVSDNAQLMSKWIWAKNTELGLDPQKLTCGSSKKAWWKCSKGHEWLAVVEHTNRGHGCPYCSGRYAIKGENDLLTVNPALENEWNYEKNGDLKPDMFTANSGQKVWWKCSKGHEWQAVIRSRNTGCGCPVCNSERKTSLPEYALVYYLKKYGVEVIHSYNEKGYELDIYIPSKNIAIEYDGFFWHKNKEKKDLAKNQKCLQDGIKLYRIREGLLPLNDSSIDYVVQKNLPEILEIVLSEIIGTSISVDLERDAIEIENLRDYIEKDKSFLVINPETAKEWNYEKNGNLRPEHLTANSGKRVWWKCSKGHEWQSTVDNRNKGYGCPYCANKKVLKGYNDLQTTNPTLAKEWNYGRNGDLKPEEVSANSSRKVWWKCAKGHEWQSTIASRNSGCGCPYCVGKGVIGGYNDLQTVNSQLASEWNYEKNGNLKPNSFTANSGQKVWWKCSKGHEWQATIDNRNNGRGCPYCASKKVLKGYNDLQTMNPDLAKEWHFGRNNELEPCDVMPNSDKKVWWKCSSGHEWQEKIANRNNGRGCPYCSRKRIIVGYSDLQAVNPALAQEWNYEKNKGLTPMDVTPNSHKKVWWKCSQWHEWEAIIKNRNKGRGCPECAKANASKRAFDRVQRKRLPPLPKNEPPLGGGEPPPEEK